MKEVPRLVKRRAEFNAHVRFSSLSRVPLLHSPPAIYRAMSIKSNPAETYFPLTRARSFFSPDA